MHSTTNLFVIGSLLALTLHSTTDAGVLNGHSAAYNNIAGTVPFNNGSGLSGTLDYAVFMAADFNANFAGLGYVPTGGLVYAFQLENTGSQSILSEIIDLSNPTSSIGTFDIGGIDAGSSMLTPEAEWTFTPGLGPGESSWGLAYSSFHTPIVGFSTVVGENGSFLFAGVPVPGSIAIPEPSTVTLFVLGTTLPLLVRRVRSRA